MPGEAFVGRNCLGPVEARAEHELGFLGRREHGGNVARVVLPVAVDHDHVGVWLAEEECQSGAHCRTLAEVLRVDHDPGAGGPGDLRRTVGGPVVDHQHVRDVDTGFPDHPVQVCRAVEDGNEGNRSHHHEL